MQNIEQISGKAVGLPGEDMDTDRIIPARYLRSLTFEKLGQHVFEDDRMDYANRGHLHPLDRPEHKGARILLVGANFGCGSSREHAAQALRRYGIEAIVGLSYGEIFAGNSVSVGMPCVIAAEESLNEMMHLAEASPECDFVVDLASLEVRAMGHRWEVFLSEGMRKQFRTGAWNPIAVLREASEQIEKLAAALPYMAWS